MNVIAKMQKQGKVCDPVLEVTWSKDTDEIGAMLAVAQLLQHYKEDTSWSPYILEVRIEL